MEVTDVSPGAGSVPTGTATISVSPSGEGVLSDTSCTLDAAGRCSFTYTPTSGDASPHVITVSYSGDGTHLPSSGSFSQAIEKRAVEIRLNCKPPTAYIY